MKNKIEDLRNHLFATIEGLLDEEKPLDIDRAKAVADVAQVLVNTAKVEIHYLQQVDASRDTGFMKPSVPNVPKLVGGST